MKISNPQKWRAHFKRKLPIHKSGELILNENSQSTKVASSFLSENCQSTKVAESIPNFGVKEMFKATL